ncbi:N-lysine methyltransferase KMT5A-like [Dendronephthya gigantea]|uniref:N-lysine methyltransferase KMT5A-like n=1 Tax=Dendronephthya gigantea TaxID=151771 RepID=UPI00106AFCFF|nr:N-lysine methyltransferase KMT5A-like [Dendronephthya gigantea]
MSSKVRESGKEDKNSETTGKCAGKSPSTSMASPPSKLSAIAKFLKSPRKQVKINEQSEKTKSKTSKSNKKGKMKNIKSPSKGSPVVGSKPTTRQGSTQKQATLEENKQTLHEEKRDSLEKKQGKGSSSDLAQDEARSIPCSPDMSKHQDVVSTPDRTIGSGKKSMVQTSLSTTKEFVELLSSPEHPPVHKKKGRKTRSKKKEKVDKKQTRITSIFPLRKSTRKTKSQQEKDEQERITKIILSKKFEGLEVRTTKGKERSVCNP